MRYLTLVMLNIAFFCLAVLGYFFLQIRKKEQKRFLEYAFLFTLAMLFLNLVLTLLYANAASYGSALLWYRLSYLSRPLFFVGLSLLFNGFLYTGPLPPRKRLFFLLLFAAPLVAGGLGGLWEASGLVLSPTGNRVVQDTGSFAYFYFLFFILFFFSECLYLLFKSLRRAASNRVKQMNRYFVRLFLFVWSGAILAKYIVPLLLGEQSQYEPGYGYSVVTLGVFGLVFAYRKYGFLQENLPLKLQLVLEHIGDGVVFADSNGRIVEWNRASLQLSGASSGQLAGKALDDLFPGFDPATCTVDKHQGLRQRWDTVLHCCDTVERHVTLYLRRVYDGFGDMIGYLAVFRINRELEELVGRYKLTARELEILKLICAGVNNKKIGKQLFISYNTVRNHVQNIYLKTGVTSKSQLIKLFFL